MLNFKVGDICRYGLITDGKQNITDPGRYQIARIAKGRIYFLNVNNLGHEFNYTFNQMKIYWTVETPKQPKYLKKTSWK